MRQLVGIISVTAIAAVALMATASPATAAVQLGQDPGPPGIGTCQGFDWAQPTVTSGNAYVAPTDGAITSWSHHAAVGGTQTMTFKMLRKVGEPATYQVVGHDTRDLTGGQPNTFTTRIPVNAGDFLGLQTTDADDPGCRFSAAGETIFRRAGNLLDGQAGEFSPVADFRLRVTALLEPDCDKDGFGDETQDTNLSTCAAPAGPAPGGQTCKGKPATIVGTNGNDVRTGSRGRDVIVGLGGNDSLSGVAGNDLICGNAGKDKLLGGKGKDKLLGQKGRDKLKGGGGKDICKGGKGKDTASKCEVEKSI